jgi:hypothetical protein
MMIGPSNPEKPATLGTMQRTNTKKTKKQKTKTKHSTTHKTLKR